MFCFTDGWTTNDVVYQWKIPEPVQFVKNLFLPGGFELENFMDGYCNVKTATGEKQKELQNENYNTLVNLFIREE